MLNGWTSRSCNGGSELGVSLENDRLCPGDGEAEEGWQSPNEDEDTLKMH